MEQRFAKLGEYQLRELQKTYYYRWREIKRDMSFFTSPEEDKEAFEKITELKKKYFEIKEYLQKKEDKILYVEEKYLKERHYYFF